MTLFNIRAVKNGYLVQKDEWEGEYIAATLKEAAVIAGEIFEDRNTIHYSSNHENQMPEIIDLAKRGQKISAIKLLRSQYNHVLGLKEAKDLVEAIASGYSGENLMGPRDHSYDEDYDSMSMRVR